MSERKTIEFAGRTFVSMFSENSNDHCFCRKDRWKKFGANQIWDIRISSEGEKEFWAKKLGSSDSRWNFEKVSEEEFIRRQKLEAFE